MHHSSKPARAALAVEGTFPLKPGLRTMALSGVLGMSAFLAACGGGDSNNET